MTMHLRHQVDVSVSSRGEIRRRDFLRGIAAASVAAGTLSWRDLVALQARELQKRGMSCILLVDVGRAEPVRNVQPQAGPRERRRNQGHRHVGPGHPDQRKLSARRQDDARSGLIRSMTSKEGSHPRGFAT